MVDAIAVELSLRSSELPPGPWQSVYFGGGTPSLLAPKQIEQLFSAALLARGTAPEAEITLEANPDDLNLATLAALADSPVNRLSIGVQSFREADLRYMNRAHSSAEAQKCIVEARAAGFDNLTIDLIYGTPGLTDALWRENLQRALDLGVPHISAYALTVEPRTALAHQIAKGKSQPVDEKQSARQMEILIETLEEAGFEQYEISNFSLPGQRAIHNSNYWLGEPYLGVGPSAHSFDGTRQRSWNIANNAAYVRAISQAELPIEREMLSDTDRYNELILTRLRTAWGLNTSDIMGVGFGQEFRESVSPLIARGLVSEDDGNFQITRRGRLLADHISAELFVVN